MQKKNNLITYVYLETSNVCNLDCVYCNRRNVVKTPTYMSLKQWDIVLEKLSIYPISEAKLMGLGEPFFHPDFHNICKNFKGIFPNAFTITATNCQYQLNDNFIKTLPYIDILYLSIDGYEENYERFRPKASWDKLIKFLDDLTKLDRGKTRITINYVVNNMNYKDIEKIHKMVLSKYNYIEEVRLNIAQWWSEDEECNMDSISKELINTLIKYKKNVKGKSPWTFSECFWPIRGFYMDVYGNVKICCLNTSTEPIGNIFESNIEEIRLSSKLLQVRKECNNDTPGLHCRKCDYKRLSPILAPIFTLNTAEI